MKLPANSATSLQSLYEDWAEDPLGKNRAVGGRRSLDGFRFQLYVSLNASLMLWFKATSQPSSSLTA